MGSIAAVVLAVGFGWVLASPDEPEASAAVAVEAEPTWPLVIKTVRSQGHHVMRVALVGPNGETHMKSLLVDTGATEIILPASMMKQLGFKQLQLQETAVQTANGVTTAWRGRLKSIELGGPDRSELLPRIHVIFVEDGALGGTALLGMNVLRNYNVTFLDSENQILLDKRR
jgi:aspartyl protease family protein